MPKRKATAAQLRNLAKGRKKLAAMRRAGKTTRGKTTRAARPTRRNPHIGEKAQPREYSTIRLRAKSDASGNPRRIFIALAHGNPKGVFDEGYSGEHAITDEAMRKAYIGLTIDVTPTEYNYWKKASKEFKQNPAHGNFMNARNVLRTGRTTNPKQRRSIPGGPRVPATYIIASIDPRPPNRIIYWGAFGWGPAGKALIFPNATDARKIAEKKMKRPAAVVKPKTAERLIREALTK